ncbi:MAG: TetR/AcrR family transcriptional regulator [Pseudomonadales bacterium]
MVKRARGRPRQFDEVTAVEAAGNVFWANGFSATSLDDLAEAMGMNRPSIYGAFGDKEALYRRALAQFGSRMEGAMRQTLYANADVRKALMNFFRQALAIYVSGPQPKGCLVMSTAVSAAVSHPEIQFDLLAVIQTIDAKIEERFQQAVKSGELPPDFDTSARAAIAQSVLHSLSLRARAGERKAKLNRLLRSGVELVFS